MHKLLIVYCEEGHTTKLGKVLSQYPTLLNFKTTYGFTLLSHATKSGQADVCSYLIQLGADVDIQNNSGQTPLFTSVSNNDINITCILLESHANPNICDRNGWSPLHVAALKGNEEMVKLLLSYNPNTMICDKCGKTPLERCKSKVIYQLIADKVTDEPPPVCSDYQQYFKDLLQRTKPQILRDMRENICIQLSEMVNEIEICLRNEKQKQLWEEAASSLKNLHRGVNTIIASTLSKYKIKFDNKYLISEEDIADIRSELMDICKIRINEQEDQKSNSSSPHSNKYNIQTKKELSNLENELKLEAAEMIKKFGESAKKSLMNIMMSELKCSLEMINSQILKRMDQKMNEKLIRITSTLKLKNEEALKVKITSELQKLQSMDFSN